MGHFKTTTVPVIIGALSMIKKEIDDHINMTTVSPSLNELQNFAVCGTAISFEEYYEFDKTILTKQSGKNKYIEDM